MKFPWQTARELTSSDIVAEFVEAYQQMRPDEKTREIGADSIEWEKPDGAKHTIMLGRVFHEIARLQKNDLKHRREIYRAFIRAVFSGDAMPDSFDTPEFLGRVLPAIRFVPYLDHVRQQAKSEVPHRALNSELLITYVIDFPDKVAHIMDQQAQGMKMDEAALYELAMKNLREFLPRADFRTLFNPAQNIVALPNSDGHAAARVLLFAEYLEDGEELAVVVKDGALLTLIEVPPDGNWNSLRSFASDATATGFTRPFWVRAGKVELM